ncbi:venom protein 302 [Periplaneta americana]|uniref:venom protein 302 n=1 Tax=Periplaneta americana TaxID=6978 RepID=UPI0037E8A371
MRLAVPVKAMTEVLCVLLLLQVSVRAVYGFSCVCSPTECEELSESDCPGGGTVWDPCGCCRVCARVENEPCGGPYGFYGSCAEGLECVVAAHATGKPVLAANSEGICTREFPDS